VLRLLHSHYEYKVGDKGKNENAIVMPEDVKWRVTVEDGGMM
jgi:hypothetical protein